MDTERYIKIREEFEELKGMIRDVNYQMQELRESIRGAPFPAQMLPMPQPYVHPWWQHQWTGPVPSRNNFGNQIQETSINLDQTRPGVSGTEEAA